MHAIMGITGQIGGVVARALLPQSNRMKNPIPRIRMLDGFNEGWIDFEHGEAGSLRGNVALETVLNALIKRGTDVH